MKVITLFLFISSASVLFGQAQTETVPPLPATAATPVKAKRKPAKVAHSEELASLNADPGQFLTTVGSIILSPTALEAVRVSEEWANTKTVPSIVPDGRVLYRYGRGLPTLVCAPLRVCSMELEAGEKVQGDPQIGDAVRWNVSVGGFGPSDRLTPMIIVKPQQSGLDTNLLVSTDRRAYYLRLISQPDTYIARVAFLYPEEEEAEKQRREQAELKPATDTQLRPADTPRLSFDYQIKGGNVNIRPIRVFDDGTKTYLEMPTEMSKREAPVLVVIGPDKKGDMVNYRVKEGTYIVDQLFDKAELRLGTGKHGQKVEISHGSKG